MLASLSRKYDGNTTVRDTRETRRSLRRNLLLCGGGSGDIGNDVRQFLVQLLVALHDRLRLGLPPPRENERKTQAETDREVSAWQHSGVT